MSYSLYKDQEEFIQDIRLTLGSKRKIIACAATGMGKSKVFIHISLQAIKAGKTVLSLPMKKIFNQIQAEVHATLINPHLKEFFLPVNSIYIAMAQTLGRRQQLINQLESIGEDLITICDEAHLGHFTNILKQIPKLFLIGFTATPDARWAKHLPLLYKAIVIGAQPHELVLTGRLCPYKHFARVAANLDLLKIQSGEFTEELQEYVFGDKVVFDNLTEDLKTLPFKKCLVFTPSIKDCDALAKKLNNDGFPCVSVHSEMTDAEFSYRLGQFTKMEINICVSVGTLTKGFDFPAIDLIVLRRATTSLPLFLQMIGRGSRIFDGKEFFTVLDYGGNYLRHGLWDMERDWADLWNKPQRSKEGVASIKVCPICEYINPLSAITCQNCGYEFTKRDIPVEVGKLVEITERYSKMKGRYISSLTAEELAIYAKLKNKKNFAARIARAKEAKRPGFLYEFAKAMNYKKAWADFQTQSLMEGNISFADFVLS